MTREELRGLIGGYATGTLSEAERKALFEAALDDQELFDELAREQALKEAIEEPGAKQRLLAAVATKPASRPWWKQTWSWAAIAAACVAVITGIVLLRPHGELQQLARVQLPKAQLPQVQPQRSALPEPPPIEAPVRRPAPPAPAQQNAQRLTSAPEVEAPKQTTAEPAPVPLPQAPAPSPAAGVATNGAASAGTLAAPAPPVGGTAGAIGGGIGGGGGGGGGRGRGGGRGGAARAFAPLAARPPAFAFDYAITAEGALRVTPSANGFLSVYSSDGNTARSLFFNRPLQAGVPAEIPLPADCVEAMVEFSMRGIAPGFLSVTGPLDPVSGTKSDPNPRPESLLLALIPVKR